jgi:hypothetical protein
VLLAGVIVEMLASSVVIEAPSPAPMSRHPCDRPVWTVGDAAHRVGAWSRERWSLPPTLRPLHRGACAADGAFLALLVAELQVTFFESTSRRRAPVVGIYHRRPLLFTRSDCSRGDWQPSTGSSPRSRVMTHSGSRQSPQPREDLAISAKARSATGSITASSCSTSTLQGPQRRPMDTSAGDLVLTPSRTRSLVRQPATAVYRYGGEEILLIVVGQVGLRRGDRRQPPPRRRAKALLHPTNRRRWYTQSAGAPPPTTETPPRACWVERDDAFTARSAMGETASPALRPRAWPD